MIALSENEPRWARLALVSKTAAMDCPVPTAPSLVP